jgi:hypothetical protein
MHGKMTNAQSCRECHTEHQGVDAELTRFDRFDHAWAAFPLSGAHEAIACAKCHADGVHKGTASTCVACHAEPKAHLGKFGVECAQCHAADSWKHTLISTVALGGGVFDHAKTAFPLTGVHMKTECKSCHTAGTFKGTSSSCVACHAEPKVHLGKFGAGCAECHKTTTWEGAAVSLVAATSFDHDKTHFKLMGKHRGVRCASCHKDSVFVGTAQTCVSCHAEPKVHKGLLGLDCVKCHTADSWKASAFVHKFPVNHGGAGRKGSTTSGCAVCHQDTVNVAHYTCYGCHAHTQEKMVQRHRRLTLAQLEKCASCHKTGRGNDRRTALDDILPFDDLCDGPSLLVRTEEPSDVVRRFILSIPPNADAEFEHP